jgi:hypothetical protein
MLIERQITERRERAAGAIAKILKRPVGEPYGDYSVKSASGKTYRLATRARAIRKLLLVSGFPRQYTGNVQAH